VASPAYDLLRTGTAITSTRPLAPAPSPELRGLREWRKYRGLSQQGLAAKAGIGQDTISRLERDCQHPHAATAAKLASALRAPVNQLFPEGDA
jgi:DNA-binding XRE family transcriptional regulator